MSRTTTSRSARRVGFVAVAGGAALAAPLAAHAESPAPTPTPTDAPATPATGAATSAPTAAAAASTEQTAPRRAAAVVPNYGFQKVRFGVQLKDGSWVPPGTTTAGTTVTYVLGEEPDQTASAARSNAVRPHVQDDGTYTCGTSADHTSGTTTFCAGADGTGFPDESPQGDPTELTLFPGQTATVTQTTVVDHVVRDTRTVVVHGCEPNPANETIDCEDADGGTLVTDVVFADPGVPPAATDDAVTTQPATAVSVPVLTNDDSRGAPVAISAVGAAGHGTTAVTGTAPDLSQGVVHNGGTETPGALAPRATGTQAVTYTPAAGFSGVDHFTYTIATANGTATATVTVTVPAAPVSVAPTSAVAPPPTPTAPATAVPARTLPFTGSAAADLVGAGATALVSGGLLYGVGRRRRPGTGRASHRG